MEFKGTKGEWIQNGINGVHNENGNCIAISEGETMEQRRANALLISKAPEMLDMIKKLLNYMPKKTLHDADMYYEANELIKQATEIN